MTMADTMLMLDRLREGGMPDAQARSIAGEFSRIITEVVATKADLRELRTELKGDIAQVRAELRSEIAQVRNEIAEVKGEVAQVRNEVAQVRGEVARLETRIAELSNEIAELRNSLADYKVGSSRWMLGIIAAIAIGFAGIIVALVVAG